MAANEWHSKEPGIIVYHNNKKCGPGGRVKPEHRATGRGGKRLCQQCRELNTKKR